MVNPRDIAGGHRKKERREVAGWESGYTNLYTRHAAADDDDMVMVVVVVVEGMLLVKMMTMWWWWSL